MRTKEAITPTEVHDDFDTQLQCEDVYAGEDPDSEAPEPWPFVSLAETDRVLEINRPLGVLSAFPSGPRWYTFYGEDAKTVSRVLYPQGFTCSKIQLPTLAIEKHIAALMVAGHKVALIQPDTVAVGEVAWMVGGAA